jgi:hypothetical protein
LWTIFFIIYHVQYIPHLHVTIDSWNVNMHKISHIL